MPGLTMDNPVFFFLLLAVFIIVLAIAITWLFRKSIKKDQAHVDPNNRREDGDAIATWSGIEGTADDH